jgi:hypothetical protein
MGEMTGARVLILAGDYAGHEGVCLGSGEESQTWGVSPDGSAAVLTLRFPTEFALLIDLSAPPDRN